jgi:hypothetical protein
MPSALDTFVDRLEAVLERVLLESLPDAGLDYAHGNFVNYEIGRLLGKGSHGKVFCVTRAGREFVAKEFHNEAFATQASPGVTLPVRRVDRAIGFF